jgi:DNA-binding NtrC family response regulator
MEGSNNLTRVLVVDDEDSQRTALASMIALWGYKVETASDGQEALDRIVDFSPHVVITDMMMPRMDGTELLKRLKTHPNPAPAIVQTAFGNLETAVNAVHELGAFWFLEKPVDAKALRLLVERAAAQGRLAERAERLERQLGSQGVLGEMVGAAPIMKTIFALIQQVAPSKAAVLISGESGTGKELAARAIHALSPRRDGPFVAVNCAALPETLMESELFGHEKGAFTGALERRAGCFELAQNGTLLLDEIGDMAPSTQAKLLRVLEDGRVRRLGGKTETQLDVRVIASTNRPLEAAIREVKFREDLFFRLNVFPIALPPLRERKDDIPALVTALIQDLNRKHDTKITDVAADTLDKLVQHSWPGNVRELRNVLERAVILAGEGTIESVHLPPGFGSVGGAPVTATINEGSTLRIPVGFTVAEAERALIELTLEHTKNNKTRAAEILGISQKTLFNKLKEYGSQGAGA